MMHSVLKNDITIYLKKKSDFIVGDIIVGKYTLGHLKFKMVKYVCCSHVHFYFIEGRNIVFMYLDGYQFFIIIFLFTK